MANSDFLAKIKLALEGKQAVIGGLKQTQQAAQELSKTKVTTVFDKQGLATGKQIEETFTKITPAAKKSFQAMGDFEKAIRRVVLVAPVWMAFRVVLMSTLQLIRDQVKFLTDLEDAMARIRIVGKGTEQEYENLRSTLVSLGMAYGVVSSAALKAAVIFAQQGKSVSEVIKLTRTAIIGSQVLGADVETTVENITAAMKAFDISADSSINIIDKLINVERNFAVTSKNLADAIKVVGSTANQMGISIDALVGDVTAVVEVTRKSGSEAARGLQFIYARLLTTGAKVVQQVAKVPIHLDEQGKATTSLTNRYRTATDVLDDVAARWDSLTNKEKLSIAQNVASKRQLTIFMALMQNYDASLRARITSLTSAGDAERAFGIIQDTLSFKLKTLSSTWNNLTLTIGDTGTFKKSIDAINELVFSLAVLIDKSQMARREIQRTAEDRNRETETAVSQRQSLIELIKIRNQFLTKPPTEKNTEMLNRINEAIKNVQKNSNIKIDIDSGNATEILNKEITNLQRRNIELQANLNMDIDQTKLESDIKNLESNLSKGTLSKLVSSNKIDFLSNVFHFSQAAKNRDALIKKEGELKKLQESRTSTIKKELDAYEAQKVAKEAQKQLTEFDVNQLDELLNSDTERIEMAKKLDFAKQSGALTNQQLLDLEIKLLKATNEQLEPYAQKVKLAELEAKRTEVVIKDLEKQISLSKSIVALTGENESALIKEEMALKAMMYGEDYIKNSMEDRLRLAQALVKEEEELEKTSSRIVDLHKISLKFGKQTAQEVAKYLGGATQFGELSAPALQALRKQAPSEFARGKAEEFFRGTDFTFPEQIEKEVRRERAVRILNQVGIDPITLNVNLNGAEIIEKTKAAISAALDDKKSELSTKIHNQIEQF